MSGTPRHGRNAAIFMDTTSAGTQAQGTTAAGTAALTRMNGRNTWSFDQTPDFVEVTAFGDNSKTKITGLPNATGDIAGNWDSAGAGTLVNNVINSTAERSLMIFADYTNNPTQFISGKAFFGVKSGGGIASAVNFDLHFEAGPTGMIWYP